MQQQKIADLFNDVMGPVMCGPSSSHTAGPCRIGRLAHDLCNGSFRSVVIEFSRKGSYALAYQGDGSDKGLTIGLMGLAEDDERMYDAVGMAKEQELDIRFVITDDAVPHANAIVLRLDVAQDRHIDARMISMGGGSVMVESIDGLQLSLYGGRYETVVYGDAQAQSAVAKHLGIKPVNHNGRMCVFSTQQAVDLDGVRATKGVLYVATMRPVVPCVNIDGAKPPFTTAAQMIDWQREEHKTLLEVAIAYQQGVSGWEQGRIYEQAYALLDRMEASIQKGLACDGRGFFCLRPVSGDVEQYRGQNAMIDTGVLNYATVMATAVMEANMSMNPVVAAPTGGSAGVIPAVLFSLEKAGATREQMAQGLLCAALIGAFIYNQATFTASVGGCAVEIGAASSMAAAGAAAMAGAELTACLRAAGLALGNLTGLACDHLASGVEVPCIQRNAMGAANAIVCANLAMAGMDPYLPYDESIQAMYDFGVDGVDAVRACGKVGRCGAAGTPTGIKVMHDYMEQFDNSRQQ